MMLVVVTALAIAAALAAQPPRHAPWGPAAAAVCADPARPCPGFRAHDLSFARVKALGRYPAANLRRMQVVFVSP